jgi:large conductance mechanosensitive channel
MIKEFQEFLNRGNVIDLAVAVILGVAFGAIITSLVNDIIMPLIGILIGGIDFTSLVFRFGTAELKYGNFLQAVLNFLLVAIALFLIVRAYNRLKRKEEQKIEEPTETKEVILLTQIRDLLEDGRAPGQRVGERRE